MRFLTADYLFPLDQRPIKNGVLQITDKGEVVQIFKNRDDFFTSKLEFFSGVICPGFVNTHCHLELSHLHRKSKNGKGLLDFIKVIKKRNDFSHEYIQQSICDAEIQMINNGIVAVGDICNTLDTLFQKIKGNLKYYNFIEIFHVTDSDFNDKLEKCIEIKESFDKAKIKSTIVPHSPYSVLPEMMRKIGFLVENNTHVISIHMQENLSENQLFAQNKGAIFDWLNKINASSDIWNNRFHSLDVLKELGNHKMLLVHNTYTKKQDITNNFYCTCPKSNLHIENALPNYSIFNEEKLCVGTDSLASNNNLSIIEELEIIQANSKFDLNTLLKIASKNGAEALGFKDLGTFKKGKKPGVNLIETKNNRLQKNTKIKVLV